MSWISEEIVSIRERESAEGKEESCLSFYVVLNLVLLSYSSPVL